MYFEVIAVIVVYVDSSCLWRMRLPENYVVFALCGNCSFPDYLSKFFISITYSICFK